MAASSLETASRAVERDAPQAGFVSSPMPSSEFDYFVLKARKLEKSSFWLWLNTRRGQSDIPRIIQGNWLAHDQLNPDEMEAFCLNLRLLIQDQDGFSIRRISQLASQWPERYETQRSGIQQAVLHLNVELDKASLVSIFKDKPTCNRDLFDVIFYGGLAHANPGKREQYERLVHSGFFSYFVFNAFCATLFHYRNCIQAIAHYVAQHVLAERGDAEAS